MKFSIDIRMNTRLAGENIFFSAPKKTPVERVHLWV
jgi:hypothetical protein